MMRRLPLLSAVETAKSYHDKTTGGSLELFVKAHP